MDKYDEFKGWSTDKILSELNKLTVVYAGGSRFIDGYTSEYSHKDYQLNYIKDKYNSATYMVEYLTNEIAKLRQEMGDMSIFIDKCIEHREFYLKEIDICVGKLQELTNQEN